MKRWQLLLLATMAALAIILFCVVASFSQTLFAGPDPTALAQMVAETQSANNQNVTPRPTSSPTQMPTATATPVPTETATPIPTPTSTRVVVDTPTPTITPTPTVTPIPTNTPVPVSSGGGSGGSGSGGGPVVVYPTATPASRYPFGFVPEPLAYETTNHFLVLLARVTQGGVPLPGYRIVGTHSPTGFQWESPPTCPYLCKASGPEAIYDENGKEIATFAIQEGNVAFEAPVYETGTWTLMLVDPQGAQASEIFQLELDSEEKMWFYYIIAK